MKLQGSIDLMKLDGATVTTIRGRNYVAIPIDMKDIYMKNSSAYLSLNIYERRQVGRYGETHTVKQGFSRGFIERMGQDAIKDKPFLGGFKPMANYNSERATSEPQQASQYGGYDSQRASMGANNHNTQPYTINDDDMPF